MDSLKVIKISEQLYQIEKKNRVVVIKANSEKEAIEKAKKHFKGWLLIKNLISL